ncbi:MAG: SdrD B-like domain-containing protein [Acidimicrobiia bacterium]|nr:SdrD B-like domain-containing protein [Acidimicrobiia bacterium]
MTALAVVALLVTALVGGVGSGTAEAAEQTSVIDFESGLNPGDLVSTLSVGTGMVGADLGTVSVVGNNPDLPGNTAMIFDSTCGGQTVPFAELDRSLCSGDDSDLYLPSLGQTLIVTEDLDPTDPDDELNTTHYWVFDFSAWGPGEVTVNSLTTGDINLVQTGSVTFYDSTGAVVATNPLPTTADGEFSTITPGIAGVASMRIDPGGSGIVDNISITADSPLIDVELTKAVDPAAVAIGDETTFSVSMVNQGPDAATGVVVEDRLPDGLTYVSHTGDGTFDPATGLWTIGDAPVETVFTLDMVVTVDEAGEFTNVAEVIAHNERDSDSTPGNNVPEEDDQDSAIVVATPRIDVELDKSVAPAAVRVGDTTTFTVVVTNQGPQDATGVVVEDRLPAGLTYQSHDGDGTFDPATGEWIIGDLAVGASVTLNFVVSVDEVGSFTNVAEVVAHNETDIDSTPDNNVPEEDDQDDATVVATDDPLIDVYLEKSVDDPEVRVGETATFTIVVGNDGPDNATGVVVEDRLPDGLSYVSSTVDKGTVDETTLIWTIGDLAVGATATMELVVEVDVYQETFENVAEVMAHNETDTDSEPGNNVPAEDDQDSAIITPTQVRASSTIGDFVWFDDDKDGIQDPDEDGVPNVTVRLTNQATSEVSTQVTNANGLYLFSGLDAGTYLVEVLTSTFPDNHNLTTVGSYTVTVLDDESFLDADFGIVEVLPITGIELETAALIGLLLLALGGALLGAENFRRTRLVTS